MTAEHTPSGGTFAKRMKPYFTSSPAQRIRKDLGTGVFFRMMLSDAAGSLRNQPKEGYMDYLRWVTRAYRFKQHKHDALAKALASRSGLYYLEIKTPEQVKPALKQIAEALGEDGEYLFAQTVARIFSQAVICRLFFSDEPGKVLKVISTETKTETKEISDPCDKSGLWVTVPVDYAAVTFWVTVPVAHPATTMSVSFTRDITENERVSNWETRERAFHVLEELSFLAIPIIEEAKSYPFFSGFCAGRLTRLVDALMEKMEKNYDPRLEKRLKELKQAIAGKTGCEYDLDLKPRTDPINSTTAWKEVTP